MVGALIALRGQFHHGRSQHGRDCVVGTAAAVTVGQDGGALLAVAGQHPAGVSLTHPQKLGGLGDGRLVFQNGVQHVEPGLFSLVQCHILHG